MGFVPQTHNIFTSMTVEENLEMGAYIRTDDFSGLERRFGPRREAIVDRYVEVERHLGEARTRFGESVVSILSKPVGMEDLTKLLEQIRK